MILYIFRLRLSVSTSHLEDRRSASSQVFVWITPEDAKSKLWCTVMWRQQEKKHVVRSPGRWHDIACMKTSTEYTTINSNRPKASSRFCCFPLPIRDSYSKLAAKNYSPIIFLFLLAIWFQMVKDHLLCSHTCQEITTLLILHIMSIINQIHYILWSVPIMYWISLLSGCNVGKKITSLNITEKMQLKATFCSSRERGLHSVIPVLQTVSLINLKCCLLLQID